MAKQKQDALECKFLESLGPILPHGIEQKIVQLKSNGVVITFTTVIEVVVVMRLCEKLKRPYREGETKMITIMNSLKQHERDYFYNVICRLGLVQTLGHMLSNLELSNELLQRGYGCLGDLNLFGLLQDNRTEDQQVDYTPSPRFSFIHIEVQRFLAAIHLLKSPLMEVILFIKNYILVNTPTEVSINSSIVLRYVFGLAKTIFGDGSFSLLRNVLKFLTQHINRDAPIIDSRISLLILQYLFEAQEVVLYRQVQNETFVKQIFSYKSQLINDNIDAFAHYILNTSNQSTWSVYATNKQRYEQLTNKLIKLGAPFEAKTTNKLISSPSRVLISNKNPDYLMNVLTDVTISSSAQAERSNSSSSVSLSQESSDSSASFTNAASILSAPDILSGPYGYLTKEQFESDCAAETTFYFNMVKDFVNPNLQMHCPTLVRTQYRKNDHIWFSFSPSMRYSFYESVQITPVVPMHWVKVPQPDGSTDLEDKFKEKAIATQSSSAPPSTNEVAELVLLNSHRMERISITPPDGSNPVLISIYRNSEQSETGQVGCDYLMDFHEVQEPIKWKKMESFAIGKDQQIGRELPLPSKKGTESAEITTSTAMANLKDLTGAIPQTQLPAASQPPQSQESIPGTSKLFAKPLGEPMPDINVSEQQIKRQAMEGFDKPGFCFYGDGVLFKMNCVYTLPEALPHTKTLRKGGNGTVLEVYYEGTFYAVKQTVFRWREVLIMPKLKHKNILKLVTMFMGPPLADYPRRRVVYQYFPRMSNDLGRSIGSYERYCLRTLKERCREETLLLSRIQSNFKYVAHEILSALHYLHTLPCPIIHRDVKPSNILVKTNCSCANPLVCVCRNRPLIMLSDFDASLELTADGELIPDSTHSRSQSYYTTQERLYHISPVGTVGFKSPEGFMHLVANSLEVLPNLSTKADIFSFGLLMVLLFINEDGPRHVSQVGTLLLSMNQTVDDEGRLPESKINMLKRSGITPREKHFTITETDKQRVLPIKRLLNDFKEMPSLISFVRKALTVDPRRRPSAQDLLSHPYLTRDGATEEEKHQSLSSPFVSCSNEEYVKLVLPKGDINGNDPVLVRRSNAKLVKCDDLVWSQEGQEQVTMTGEDQFVGKEDSFAFKEGMESAEFATQQPVSLVIDSDAKDMQGFTILPDRAPPPNRAPSPDRED